MFRGSIPADMRSIIHEVVGSWDVPKVYVGCSGNFTIERVLHAMGGREIHGNDVTLYSSAVGAYLAGYPLRLSVRDEMADEWGWLSPYMETPEGAVAVIMLGSRMFQGLSRSNAYYDRLRAEYQAEWEALFSKTVDRVKSTGISLGSFHVGDVVEWAPGVPDDAGIICFPPFYAGDYESMFRNIEKVIAWDKPEYEILDDARLQSLFACMGEKRHWLIGNNVRRPELEPWLRGMVRTTNRGVPIYVYGSVPEHRVVTPRQQTAPVLIPRLQPGGQIGERLGLVPLTMPQFAALRSKYMNHNIRPGTPSISIGVTVDGVLVGCYAVSVAPTMANYDSVLPGPWAYLLSDFPVAPTDYGRLAKLIVMAAYSKESKVLIERAAHGRVRSMTTTAFANRPVSMKYRGVLKLLSRREPKEPQSSDPTERYTSQYQLNYGAVIGDRNLDEVLHEWKRRHGQRAASTQE